MDLRSSRETLSQVRAQLDQAKDRLAKTSVYAPIDGTVTSLDIKVGETAISSTTNIPGSTLMTIANPDSILTEVNVDEADIANIAPGQRARIYAIAYPDKPVDGEVTSIAVSAKVAEGQQGLSFAVKIRLLDRAQITLRPGMSCRAEIFAASRDNVLAVPIQAIRVEEDMTRNETRRYAFVDRGGTAKRVAVEVGLVRRHLSGDHERARGRRLRDHRARSRAARAQGRRRRHGRERRALSACRSSSSRRSASTT